MAIKNWVWYGYPVHFCGGSDCRYHLATRIGKFVVSTVGDYRPTKKEKETLSIAKDSFFETMIFECYGEDKFGNPNLGNSIWTNHYSDSLEAEKSHRDLCLKIDKKEYPWKNE